MDLGVGQVQGQGKDGRAQFQLADAGIVQAHGVRFEFLQKQMRRMGVLQVKPGELALSKKKRLGMWAAANVHEDVVAKDGGVLDQHLLGVVAGEAESELFA
ncbi:hypothetical protein D9M72_629090 [compost metagenome]